MERNGARSNGSVVKKLVPSIALALVPLIGARIPLPGLDHDSEWVREASTSTTSLFALGVSPLLSGYLAVEFAALVVPRWRSLRHDFPAGRAKLERAAGVLVLVLAAFQAFGLALAIEGMAQYGRGSDVNRWFVVLSLLGATSVMLLLARLIDRLGMLCGVIALHVVLQLDTFVDYLRNRPPPADPLHFACTVALYAAPFVLTWVVLRGWAPKADSRSLWLPVPVSSFHPVSASSAGLAFLLLFAPASLSLASHRHQLELRLATALAMALVLAWVLQAPQRIAPLLARAARAPVDEEAISRASLGPLAPSLVFVATLCIAEELLTANALPIATSATVALTALILDGRDALQARRRATELVCVWQERRPYLVPPVVAAAADEGLTLHALGVAQTSLLRFFGPFASIGLWCERAEVSRALRLIAERLEDGPVAPPGLETETEPKLGEPAASGGRYAWLLYAAAALVTMLTLFHWTSTGLRSFASGDIDPNAAFELLEVNDEANPLEALQSSTLPATAVLYEEQLRDDDPHLRRLFLRVTPQEGESLAQALAPLTPVLESLELPPGSRWIWQQVQEDEEDALPLTRPTYRSFLVWAEPRFTTRDLSSAELSMGDDGASWSMLRFDAEAADRLQLFSRARLGHRIVIALDGGVITASQLTGELKGGTVIVQHGSGAPEEQHAAAVAFLQKLTH